MKTPFEDTGQPTSVEEGEEFLDLLSSTYDIPVVTLAHSVEGRPIRAALIGQHPEDADQVCLMVCLQHGDEPASREAAYAIIRDLGKDTTQEITQYLESTSWVIIPTANPDRCHVSRRNANNVDLNRDWEDQSQPETQATLMVLENWEPTLVLDAHEMNHEFDAWVGTSAPSKNAPVHPEISRISLDAQDHIAQEIVNSGSTWAYYGESGAMVLRTYAATQHAVSMLVETYKWQDERALADRIEDQTVAFRAMRNHHAQNYEAYQAAADISRNPDTSVQSSGVPWLSMWDSPRAKMQGKHIIDAYLQTSAGKVRAYDHLTKLLEKS